ncbi:methionine--tRNA ligase, mitochondrial-like [Penaeus indicus]|uniref:methionine--tRNA ligase, mitochondrial-like n=1 Tax=Penaeus indicus TaxID=29960 RepID=UPI00300CB2CC
MLLTLRLDSVRSCVNRRNNVSRSLGLLKRCLSGIRHSDSEKVDKSETTTGRYFVTTPIFYVNAEPHIGHVHSALLADAAQRFQKLQNPAISTTFSTGTDEHGLKIQQSSMASDCDPLAFCNQVSHKFKALFDLVDIGYTDYIRTVEDRHKIAVGHFFNKLKDNGHIYQGNYSGWYCVSDEAYLTELQVREVQLQSGEKQLVSLESGHPVEWNSEDNYMFRLSSFQQDLQYWLNDDQRVQPERYLQQLRGWVSEELHDLSVSRPKKRVSWGIPVPGDSKHTIYVWVDALVNYLTVAGYPDQMVWPPDVQVLGKDILRFHGIYWPALLMAAGLDPPNKLLCHSHWTVEGEKMSKSKGNVVCPKDRVERFTSDGLRYFLLREGTPHSDSSWSDTRAVRLLNAELADSLGNLMNRCTAQSLNPHQQRPPLCPQYKENMPLSGQKLVEQLAVLPDLVEKHYTDFNFYRGIDVIMAAVRQANVFVQEERPWELKNQTDRRRLDSVLRVALEAVCTAGIALQPIVPRLASCLLDATGVPDHQRCWNSLREGFYNVNQDDLSTSYKLGTRTKLFRKIKD